MDEAIKIMAKVEKMPEKEMRYALDVLYQPDLKGQLKGMQDSNDLKSLYRSGRIIVDFYFKKGQLSEFINLDSIIDPQFINKLNNH